MNFRDKYVLAVIATAFLIITNQVVIQYFLSQKRYDAKVINISGKQRMLSQRLMGFVHHYNLTKDVATKNTIGENFKEWEKVHYSLINGNKELGLNKVPDNIAEQLHSITPNLLYAKDILENIENLSANELGKFKENQSFFLVEMNKVVVGLEQSSNNKLKTIVILEIFLALLTLIVLCAEVLWVFVPAVQQLAQQNRRLEKNNRILEDYAYIASHDLRTPVANILGFANLLSKKTSHKLNADEQKYLEYIKKGANRMNDSTRDLVAYALAGKVNKRNINIREVVKGILADMEKEIGQKSANIALGDLPVSIIADKPLMELLIQNLISNALKYMPEGRVPEVNISSTKKANTYVFEVKDNGIGISRDEKQDIFGLFKRLHTTKEYEGSGVGLALCKRIIEGHKGKIWVESVEGQGSAFYFTIPS